MKKKLLMVALAAAMSLCAIFAITACGGSSPWCGKYYGGSDSTTQAPVITITGKKFKMDDGSDSISKSYTIANDTITLETGAKFKLAEDYNVCYMEKYSAGKFPANQRDGYFHSLRWKPLNMPSVEVNFKSDGDLDWMESYSDAQLSYSGTYTLNSGVLIINIDGGHKIVGNSIIQVDYSARLYMYVDESFTAYTNAHLRDYKLFLEPNQSPSGSTNPNPDNGGMTAPTPDNNGGTTTPNPDNGGTTTPNPDNGGTTTPNPDDGGTTTPKRPLHLTLDIGTTCSECGLEIYLKADDDVLLFNREENYARAEYYGESATSVFQSFSSLLREVYISENVKKITHSAFSSCSVLESVEIAEEGKLTTIESYAFSHCYTLTEFIIPTSATEKISIGSSVFSSCSALTTISLPKNVISVGIEAFSSTAWYKTQPEGEIAYLGHIAYKYKGNVPFDASLTVRDGVTVIADYCFSGQGFLRRITLPKSLQYIGERAFYGCTSLLNVTLPSSLISIEYYAFRDCISITEITIPASVTRISQSAFYCCASLSSVAFEDPDGWVDSYYSSKPTVDFYDPVANVEKFKRDSNSYYYEKTKEE